MVHGAVGEDLEKLYEVVRYLDVTEGGESQGFVEENLSKSMLPQ